MTYLNMVNPNFTKQLNNAGREGERIFELYCSRSKKVKQLKKANIFYQRKGIDYLVTNTRDVIYAIEVKYDVKSSTTNNFYIETEQHHKRGWLFTTQADWLFMIHGNTGSAAFVRPYDLLTVVKSKRHILKTVECHDDYKYSSKGILLPKHLLPGSWITLKTSISF